MPRRSLQNDFKYVTYVSEDTLFIGQKQVKIHNNEHVHPPCDLLSASTPDSTAGPSLDLLQPFRTVWLSEMTMRTKHRATCNLEHL